MIKILLVEDDADKLKCVSAVLESVAPPGSVVNTALDAAQAKSLLQATTYDLLVLDIALPIHKGRLPEKDEGIRLLEEVFERDLFHAPKHIVGLTAYQEMLELARPLFAEELWHVILYDPSSELWSDQLRRKVRHIVESNSQTASAYNVELCVMTALASPELKAVLRLPWSWSNCEMPSDGTVYYSGEFVRGSVPYKVMAASASRMGMIHAAVLATKMINSFRPKYLALTGILAGVPGSCEPGDIIIADTGWDYGSGKRVNKAGSSVFEPAPYQITLDASLHGKFIQMSQNQADLDEIRRSWQGKPSKTPLSMHLGPVASGAQVLQDPNIIEDIKKQHRKVIGVEMETYGVLAAGVECPLPRPKVFSIKSVCDFGDQNKSDEAQDYAAFTSAMALRMFVERYLR